MIIDLGDYKELEELDSDLLDIAIETLQEEKERRKVIERNEAKKRLQKILDEASMLITKYHFSLSCENEDECFTLPSDIVSIFIAD